MVLLIKYVIRQHKSDIRGNVRMRSIKIPVCLTLVSVLHGTKALKESSHKGGDRPDVSVTNSNHQFSSRPITKTKHFQGLQLIYQTAWACSHKVCRVWRSLRPLAFLSHDNTHTHTVLHIHRDFQAQLLKKTHLLFCCFSFRRLLFRVRARFSTRLVVLFVFLEVLFTLPITLSAFLLIVRVWWCLVVIATVSARRNTTCTFTLVYAKNGFRALPVYLQTCDVSSCPSSCASWTFYSFSLVSGRKCH